MCAKFSVVDSAVQKYCEQHTSQESSHLQNLRFNTNSNITGAHMMSGVIVGNLLTILTQSMHARYALEIGTFSGYSSLKIAEGLGPCGTLFSCESDAAIAEIARQNFAASAHGSKIKLLEGDAQTTIPNIQPKLDLVFIDARKSLYRSYYDLVFPKLRVGGLVIIDNTLFQGEVLSLQRERGRVMDEFNKYVCADKRVTVSMLPLQDGVTLVVKNREN